MPTYEYACTACGNEFERFESITAKPNNTCPKCKAKKGERKISGGGGFIFKGTGFYITDYKKGGGGAKTPENKPSEGKPAESKPAESAPAAVGSSEGSSGGSCGSGCGCHPAPATTSKPAKSSAKSSSAK